MSDANANFEINIHTTADLAAAKEANAEIQKSVETTQAATQATREYASAEEQAAASADKFAAATAKIREEQGLGRGRSGLASDGIAAAQTEEEKKALQIEQERAALEERRNALISQRVAIQETETELLAALAAGEKEKIASLSAELEVRKESLQLQFTGILSEEEAADIALQRFRSREAIALQDRAQEQLNERLIAQAETELALEKEIAAAQEQLNQELIEEEVLRQRNEAAILANVRAVQAQAAAEDEVSGEGALRGASYAGRRGLGSALGIGVRGLAGGLPQIAAFIAITEALRAVGTEWERIKKVQAEARAEQERFFGGLQAMAAAQSDLAAVRQAIHDSRTAMAQFADETERQNRALEQSGRLSHQMHGAESSIFSAEGARSIAEIEAGVGSEQEKAAQIANVKKTEMAEKQRIEQEKISGDIGRSQLAAQEAQDLRWNEKARQNDLEGQINEKTEQMRREALLAQQAQLGGHGADARLHGDQAGALENEIKELTDKYAEQAKVVEKAKQEEQKIADATAAQVELLRGQAKSSADLFDIQKKQFEAEEKHQQELREKKAEKERSGVREKEIAAALAALPQDADDARSAASDLVHGRLPGAAPRTSAEDARNQRFIERERLLREQAGLRYQRAGEGENPDVRAREQQLVKEEEARRRFTQLPPDVQAATEAGQVAGAHAGSGSNTGEMAAGVVSKAQAAMSSRGGQSEIASLVRTIEELLAHGIGLSPEEKRMLRDADQNAKTALDQIKNSRH